ncbi:MAG: hypothetical protein AAGB31_13050 [Bdellovibrio sp.]
MKKIFLILVLTALSFQAPAHEGHDHDGKTVQAPKGGVIKSLESHHIEVVTKGQEFRIYIYDANMKLQDPAPFKVSAQAELPRTKKKESLTLKTENSVLIGSHEAKGWHRYTLILSVTPPTEAHTDTLKFTIEPKK